MGKKMNAIRRAWRWLWCNHRNSLRHWNDAEGWNIMACARCGRCWIFTDGADPDTAKQQAIQRTDRS